ncbi:thiol-disulfide oxidoreductase DCC family protein [Aliidiomarina sp. Khilg15.8]
MNREEYVPKKAALTIFYDGGCPLCRNEMRHLEARDEQNQIAFVDIHQPGFSAQHPEVDKEQANRILQGRSADGTMLYGLDVTHRAWSLAGKGWLTAPLRWPLIRWFADKVYLFFARNRNGISRLLTGQSRCDRD